MATRMRNDRFSYGVADSELTSNIYSSIRGRSRRDSVIDSDYVVNSEEMEKSGEERQSEHWSETKAIGVGSAFERMPNRAISRRRPYQNPEAK